MEEENNTEEDSQELIGEGLSKYSTFTNSASYIRAINKKSPKSEQLSKRIHPIKKRQAALQQQNLQ